MHHAANKTPMAKTATNMAAATAKKPASANMTGKTKANYRFMAPIARVVSKLYGLGNHNKYAVMFNTEGLTDFALVQFM